MSQQKEEGIYQNCLEASQLENNINHLERKKTKNKKTKKTDIDSLKKDHKEFIKNNQLILKTQQRIKSKRCNVFTEEINRIALSSNDDKRKQSIDSIETYAYETSKVLVSEKQEIKYNSIIKRHKND